MAASAFALQQQLAQVCAMDSEDLLLRQSASLPSLSRTAPSLRPSAPSDPVSGQAQAPGQGASQRAPRGTTVAHGYGQLSSQGGGSGGGASWSTPGGGGTICNGRPPLPTGSRGALPPDARRRHPPQSPSNLLPDSASAASAHELIGERPTLYPRVVASPRRASPNGVASTVSTGPRSDFGGLLALGVKTPPGTPFTPSRRLTAAGDPATSCITTVRAPGAVPPRAADPRPTPMMLFLPPVEPPAMWYNGQDVWDSLPSRGGAMV